MRFDLKSFQFVDTDLSPDALAIAAADRSLSWSQLRDEAQAWADVAREQGVAPMCRWPSTATKKRRSSSPWWAHC